MKSKMRRKPVRMLVLLLAVLMLMLGIESVSAHLDDGYSHDATIGYTNKNWISNLPDDMLLSYMSIPGTHDTMTYQVPPNVNYFCNLFVDSVKTQSMDLETQLNSGIRLLDIRARHMYDTFEMYHGGCYLGSNFDDVLVTVTDFLHENKDEFVLMKIKEESEPFSNSRSFQETLNEYVSKYPSYFWIAPDPAANPTLLEIRGKIVVTSHEPGPYSQLAENQQCDDAPFNGKCWQFGSNWDLYPKWENVKAQLNAADKGNLNTFYKNALNGAGGSFPYFVASGHSSHATGALRLLTGSVVGKNNDTKWPDFPRVSCGSLCSIAFEGVNTLTKDYIRDGKVTQRVGWIWTDFPGSGLIDEIIQLNFDFVPPATADAGGPYVANEGEKVTFDASASSASDGSPLKYLWDYIESDPWVWELAYVDDAMVSYTWYDDYEGTLTVAVTDDQSAGDQRIVYASTNIQINNVAPTIESIGIDAAEIDEGDTITVSGTFSDPALGAPTETFTGTATWNDGVTTDMSVGEGTFLTSRTFADDDPSTGTAFDDFTVDITITDDDKGSDTATSPPVRVRNEAPTIDSISVDVTTINESETVTVSGTFSDIALGVSSETFSGQATWSDGASTAVNVDSHAGTYSTSRTFADDHPDRGTASDDFTVEVMISDDDLGSDTATSPTVTVHNVAPTIGTLVIDSTSINEGGTVTASGTFSDPGLGAETEIFSGQGVWSDGETTAVIVDSNAGTYSTSRTFADDHPDSGTASDDFTVEVTISDDDLGSDTATSSTVTVHNVAPTIDTVVVDSASINEADTVTVSGTFSDPGLGAATEIFSGHATWSDGEITAVAVNSITGAFSTSRTFADDHPQTGTPADDFTVEITIDDDDQGSASATSPIVTVNNLPPVTRIDSIIDETGADVGSGLRVVLIHTQIDLQGSFTDIGIPDTHTANIDWDDGSSSFLGATSGSILTAHVYTEPGVYTALLEVTDDDTGVGPVTASIEVVDAAGAVQELISELVLSAEDTGLQPDAASALNEALAKLEGQNGGKASGGALDALLKGNLNAALVKMGQAMQSLETAEAADATLDLTFQKSLLALTAKSAAITAIGEADAAAKSRNEMAKVADANDLINEADAMLAALNYVDAVEIYREAAQQVQGIAS